MNALDRVLPTPRVLEIDSVELAASPEAVWERVRHGTLGDAPLVKALFAVRTLSTDATLCIDDLESTAERPGFQVLVDEPPRTVVVGAIGKVWKLDIPFVHVADAAAFAAFDAKGYVKVAWSISVSPLGVGHSRLDFEVRVDATDGTSWKKFRAYFALIGPGSRFIRRSLLSGLARELGTPEGAEQTQPLPGDDRLPDARAQITHGITIDAPPAAIWPWLLQMGSRRAGFYSWDVLDNGGTRSAREIHREWQDVHVGDVLPATPRGDDGFEVLELEPERALVLGGLFDPVEKRQLPFDAPRPAEYWHVTWAFALEPLDERRTRLHVRVRGAYSAGERFHAATIRPIHDFMQGAQLRNLAARAEGRESRDDWRDVADGAGGAAVMAAAALTPFLRNARSHWGIDAATAAREWPGDDRVPAPRWSWTHAVEIEAPAARVWPWIVQIGADRGGFYSYQWLENLAGCRVANAEQVHASWVTTLGDALVLHPDMPPIPIVEVAPGRYFLAHASGAQARAEGRAWVDVSWLFLVDPLDNHRCRFVSRYRCATSDDLATRLQYGPALLEPIGFAMDRRMLLGVKERAEHAA